MPSRLAHRLAFAALGAASLTFAAHAAPLENPPDAPRDITLSPAGRAAAALALPPCPPHRDPSLWALLDEHVRWIYAGDPISASLRGYSAFDPLIPDESPAALARRLAEARARLDRLNLLRQALRTTPWSEDDQLDADLLAFELSLRLEGAQFHPEQLPISAIDGPHIWLPQLPDQLAIRTPAQREAWVARLEQLPTLLDQHIANMSAGLAAGRTPPRVVLQQSAAVARTHGNAELAADPTKSLFFRPLAALPASDPLAQRARRAVAEGIIPAFARLADFLASEYEPAARTTLGASESVDGPALYDFMLRSHTTTRLSADEIHQLGLREVDRIHAEMMQVIERTDFRAATNAPASLTGKPLFDAFVHYLRTDPRFYFDQPAALLAGYRDIAKRIDAELPSLFATLPRNPYGVREMPAFMAPTSPVAFYYPGSLKNGIAGFFVANTYDLKSKPRWGMVSLTLHEAVPGHHLQTTIQDEIAGAHELRRLTGYTSFVEGWALYAERLGLEVGSPGPDLDPHNRGLYADPYDDFGRLGDEMWRACRLVVDTGLHAKQWTRQQAIDYMADHSAEPLANIAVEVDRYIGWPGQATAYKIGQLKISELRARAEAALGPRFDRRLFHDEVLSAGAIPLDVLEARINRWIAASSQHSAASPSSAAP